MDDWLEAFDNSLNFQGQAKTRQLLESLQFHAQKKGVAVSFTTQTPYINTIHASEQPVYPGNREIEKNLKNIIRWNAMAMVVRANRENDGVGGHISSYASIATLYEVAYHHFFHGADYEHGMDLVYFQGHASPGNYSRAFLEGRLTEDQLLNFRNEVKRGTGLSSYPHPWLMPDFWQFPTVSMGLGPLMAVYQARFLRYLENRGLTPSPDIPHQDKRKVWCFIGDGESDEPETLAALSLAAREKLDNLIFVVNCNLQRLDGPVRGNSKIIQELEGVFRGAGWNAIKLIWGREWDRLLDNDHEGHLVNRMNEVVDGEYQNYTAKGGKYIRENFYGANPELAKMVEDLPDEALWKMSYGGHDAEKVYSAFHAAVRHQGTPTVVLAKTIKGYGLGEAGEGRNVSHQQKKLNEDELLQFKKRFRIPIEDNKVKDLPFYQPGEDSPEIRYLNKRREELGGDIPCRRPHACDFAEPDPQIFEEFYQGIEKPVSTTIALVRMLTKLIKDKNVGKRIVPIVTDEARTFGMEALFRQIGIYSAVGQLYTPVDSENLMFYKEAKDGQMLQEGITEAGAISSFIAAGTSYANHQTCMIPFFLFYSMFGFQRIGDSIWAAADSRTRGFLIGGTSGRTTLNGEGLQHQDGHSHLQALTVPNLMAYDPCFAFEVSVIVKEGFRRMYQENEDVFYYITVGNENYPQRAMPSGAEEGILKGMYLLQPASKPEAPNRVQLLGSGSLINDVLKAQGVLAENYDIHADVWSVTSYQQVHREAQEVERWNMLHPEEEPKESYLKTCLQDKPGPLVACSDYLKALTDIIGHHVDRKVRSLGTDGFGRSGTREGLRDFFEVDYRYIVLATLHELAVQKQVGEDVVSKAIKELSIDADKPNPLKY